MGKNTLMDNTGWVANKQTNFSFWGINSIDEESYIHGKQKNLMNEGSTSRAFSFNIYLKPEVIYYNRH